MCVPGVATGAAARLHGALCAPSKFTAGRRGGGYVLLLLERDRQASADAVSVCARSILDGAHFSMGASECHTGVPVRGDARVLRGLGTCEVHGGQIVQRVD